MFEFLLGQVSTFSVKQWNTWEKQKGKKKIQSGSLNYGGLGSDVSMEI